MGRLNPPTSPLNIHEKAAIRIVTSRIAFKVLRFDSLKGTAYIGTLKIKYKSEKQKSKKDMPIKEAVACSKKIFPPLRLNDVR
jgi:hypothetical protein